MGLYPDLDGTPFNSDLMPRGSMLMLEMSRAGGTGTWMSSNPLSTYWCNMIVDNQIRMGGLAGSVVLPIILREWRGGNGALRGFGYELLSGSILLPVGYFLGTAHPPIIKVAPQYGDVVIYRHLWQMENTNFWREYPGHVAFHTWVQELNYTLVPNPMGSGTTVPQWSFKLGHMVMDNRFEAEQGFGYRYPWQKFNEMWWPLWHESDPSTGWRWSIIGNLSEVVLNWYAFGVDTGYPYPDMFVGGGTIPDDPPPEGTEPPLATWIPGDDEPLP